MLFKHEMVGYGIVRAIDNYRPADRYRGHIVQVRTEQGSASPNEVLNKQWEELATEGSTDYVLPGDHKTWLDDGSLGFSAVVARHLSPAEQPLRKAG